MQLNYWDRNPVSAWIKIKQNKILKYQKTKGAISVETFDSKYETLKSLYCVTIC